MDVKLPANIELKNLFIDVHCIGKNPQGEGILFVIRKNDYILFSMIIDEGYDVELLKNENIDKFDYICWTHPHDDHSTGIKEIIENHTKKYSKVIVPNGIYDVRRKMTPKCKASYKPILELNKNKKRRNGEYIEVNQYSHLLNNTFIDNKGNKIELEIKAISPISRRVNNIRSNKIVNMNDLSITLIIRVNDVGFLFTSDIYNNVINDMDITKELFNNVVYCKIPHHGSNYSDNILNYLPKNEGNKIAVTTIYKNNGEDTTPKKELINEYQKRNYRVYCTSESYINNIQSNIKNGIVSVRVKLENNGSDSSLRWDVKFTGEAIEIPKIREEKNILLI